MNNIPTAEEYFKPFRSDDATYGFRDIENHLRKFAQLHVEAALKAAAGEAKIDLNGCCEEQEFDCSAQIDKKSILNAYPKENIK